MTSNKQRMFVTDDGKSVVFTFCIVSSLFLLWGFCNGMIDVMDKHFQEELHLTLVPIRLGAVCPLSRLFPDVIAGGLAGHQAGVQRRDHRRPPLSRLRRLLVYPGDAPCGLLGVFAGGLFDSVGPHVS